MLRHKFEIERNVVLYNVKNIEATVLYKVDETHHNIEF